MPSLTQMRIAFLLGSGISIPAGMPSTQAITKQVLSGEGIMRHTDGNYYFDKPLYAHEGIPDEYVPRVTKFLNRLKAEIDDYYAYQPERFTNYEDLYYIASQIHDSELKEYDNPVVQPFIDKISSSVQPLLESTENEIKEEWELHELAYETTCYIKDVVWRLLCKEPNRLDHLNFVKCACLDSQLLNIDISTLNHDTILDRFLTENDVQIIDGFGEPLNKVRYWSPDLFDSGDSKIRIFKLHGSVNWFRFLTEGEGRSRSYESIGIPEGWDYWHTKSPQGQNQRPVDTRPIFLAGTFNKMLQYTSDIYADLYYRFYRSLSDTQRLLVCGYGFGDKGINRRIFEWIYSSRNHRLIIIHPDSEKLKEKARGVLTKNWDGLVKHDKLIFIPMKIENTSWQEIKGSFLKE